MLNFGDQLLPLRGSLRLGRLRAPRIINNLQRRCAHEKAAEEVEEQENLISTNDEIV
jgi:hypothetical protein